MYDVLIIGAGISGATIARELSKFKINIAILDKETDVSNGTTKANSAIVHGGYDAREGTLMAKYNVLGNIMYEELCNEMHVPFKRNGSIVLAFSEEEREHLEILYKRGIINGVSGLKIVEREELCKLEPNVSDDAIAGLYCSVAGIVSPYELTAALMDNAIENGTKLFLNTEVLGIKKLDEKFLITTDKEKFEAKFIINCSGVNADLLNNMIAPETFKIIPRKGEYFVLDKSQGKRVNTTVFQCPSKLGKGILVTPTVHGNLLVGPDSTESFDREDLSTRTENLDHIRALGSKSIKDINFRENIRTFAGMRAEPSTEDFIIGESETKGFYNVAGIKSPGLTAAPAIALEIVKMLSEKIELEKKGEFKKPKEYKLFMELSKEEKAKKIAEDERYGRIICRCEMITEGEIIEAINRPAKAMTLDAVKRRCRPGSGRCQGGFCGPRVQEILAKELEIDIKDVILDKKESFNLVGELKK